MLMDTEGQTREKEKEQSVYFKLTEAVGTKGKYQTILVIFACIVCIQNGIISLGVSYYFAVAPYTNCPSQYSGKSKCTEYVCSLPAAARSAYLQPQISQLTTLGNQFGDYHCSKSDMVQTSKGLYFFGAILGFIVIGVLADNVGRRLSLIICLLSGVMGYIIMLFASNLIVAGIGLCVVGFSIESSFNMVFYLLSEMLQNDQRQKMQTFIQAFLPLGGMFIVLAFYLFKDWKFIFLVFCLIPYAICFVFAYFFVVQTPQFLVKRYSVEEIRQNLRFVAKLNGKEEEFDRNLIVSYNHIQQLKAEYNQQMKTEHSIPFTYIDLFRYKSLRIITICSILLFFSNNFLYNAPLLLIDQFGFDFYLNGIILNFSELITYFYSFFAITTLKRRSLNIVTSILSLICSFMLIFLHTNEICIGNCSSSKMIYEMIVVFILRFTVSLQYQVVYIYVGELYPIQVGGMGLGFGCVIGHIPNVFLPELINVLNRSNFSIMIIFCIVACICLGVSIVTEETNGRAPLELIQEIHHGQLRKDGFELVNEKGDQ